MSNVEKVTVSCQSVVGGWVTLVERSGTDPVTVGPVFTSLTKLWAWQKKNMPHLALGYYDSLKENT
jgi:hypothetical protein